MESVGAVEAGAAVRANGGLESAGGRVQGQPREAWRRWGFALAETAGVVVAFVALGLVYGTLAGRAPAPASGYVAERAAAPEESRRDVARIAGAWSGATGSDAAGRGRGGAPALGAFALRRGP